MSKVKKRVTRRSPVLDRQPDVALVLGGGNALGAYLAGAYHHLHHQGIRPSWIAGTSIGAVTGAILAGNAPDDRLAKLDAFWEEAVLHTSTHMHSTAEARQLYNGVHSMLAWLYTRPSMFRHRFPGPWSVLPWMPNDVALYDHSPLRQTLERLVDFDRLNGGEVRLSIGCVDMETGENVYFDNTRQEIGPQHILASGAIVPVFPPVEIDGRLLCDPGYTNNLPLDCVFVDPPHRDLFCIAVELFSMQGRRPGSLDAVLERTSDLAFASSTERTIKALQREYALRERLEPDGPLITVLHVAYQAPESEVFAKTFDYSRSSIRDRWAAGQRDIASGLGALGEAFPDERRFRHVAISRTAAAANAAAP